MADISLALLAPHAMTSLWDYLSSGYAFINISRLFFQCTSVNHSI